MTLRFYKRRVYGKIGYYPNCDLSRTLCEISSRQDRPALRLMEWQINKLIQAGFNIISEEKI